MCKIRGHNKHGAGNWSFFNEVIYMNPCSEKENKKVKEKKQS